MTPDEKARFAELERVVRELAERNGIEYPRPAPLEDCGGCAGAGFVVTPEAEVMCIECGGSGKRPAR